MEAQQPVIYVIAGPNGIGKSTGAFDLIPATVPVINSDEIARITQLAGRAAVNMQEWSNREAMRLLNEHLAKRESFGMETNLADNDTWRFLLGVQEQGYFLHLLFICTDALEVLNQRIRERQLRGEHFVRPDIVRERYLNGLSLLKHYFRYPDKLQLFDNSETLQLVAERSDTDIVRTARLPHWVSELLDAHMPQQRSITEAKHLDSIEEVRQRYRKSD